MELYFPNILIWDPVFPETRRQGSRVKISWKYRSSHVIYHGNLLLKAYFNISLTWNFLSWIYLCVSVGIVLHYTCVVVSLKKLSKILILIYHVIKQQPLVFHEWILHILTPDNIGKTMTSRIKIFSASKWCLQGFKHANILEKCTKMHFFGYSYQLCEVTTKFITIKFIWPDSPFYYASIDRLTNSLSQAVVEIWIF